jgi:hypothetical protein
MSRRASAWRLFVYASLTFSEIAFVFVCFDYIARVIVNANHGTMPVQRLAGAIG